MKEDPNSWIQIKEDVQKSVIDALKKIKVKVKDVDVRNSIEVPPSSKMGDLACSIAFQIGKKVRKSPRLIAEQLLDKIKKPASIKKIKLSGAYLNFQFDRKKFAKKLISEALKENYGAGEKKKERVMVEYSQPNPLKAFHIGHIRGTTLGDSLARILEYAGYETIKANYYNDLGTHVAKGIWCYLKFHKGEIPKENISEWFSNIYAEASQKVEENPKYKEEVSEIHKKLEARDEEIVKIWKELRDLSIKEFDRIYNELGVEFDQTFYESEIEKRGKEIVKELLKKKIARKSEGAVIVSLKKYGLDVLMLLKSDGTALYATKDLALAEEKFKKFKIDRSIYVVGVEQRLYFKQLFKTLELMGFKQAKKCYHLAYELVNLAGGGKISSRTGQAILYNDLKERMVQKAIEEVLERNPEMDPYKQREIAENIAIGAMRFSMLNIGSTKTIFFDWNRALEFEGETGPYIQYAAVRAKRILEKVKEMPKISNASIDKIEEETHELIKHISKFPEVLLNSAENYEPHRIASYSYKLAEYFNAFYNNYRVLDEKDKKVRDLRILIVSAAFNTLRICLNLLGIEIPERM